MQLLKKAYAARAAVQAAAAESSRRSNLEQQVNEPTQIESTSSSAPASTAPDPVPSNPMSGTSALAINEPTSSQSRQTFDSVDEVLQTLKTTFPLLILSLETMVDQIQHKFKPSSEEEVYRNICMLLSDAIQVRSNPTILTHNLLRYMC